MVDNLVVVEDSLAADILVAVEDSFAEGILIQDNPAADTVLTHLHCRDLFNGKIMLTKRRDDF